MQGTEYQTQQLHYDNISASHAVFVKLTATYPFTHLYTKCKLRMDVLDLNRIQICLICFQCTV